LLKKKEKKKKERNKMKKKEHEMEEIERDPCLYPLLLPSCRRRAHQIFRRRNPKLKPPQEPVLSLPLPWKPKGRDAAKITPAQVTQSSLPLSPSPSPQAVLCRRRNAAKTMPCPAREHLSLRPCRAVAPLCSTNSTRCTSMPHQPKPVRRCQSRGCSSSARDAQLAALCPPCCSRCHRRAAAQNPTRTQPASISSAAVNFNATVAAPQPSSGISLRRDLLCVAHLTAQPPCPAAICPAPFSFVFRSGRTCSASLLHAPPPTSLPSSITVPPLLTKHRQFFMVSRPLNLAWLFWKIEDKKKK
jgi:hypothetical protein